MRTTTSARFGKIRIVIVFTSLIYSMGLSAAPSIFSYQGRITSAAGAAPGFTMASFSFSIMIDKAGGRNPNCTIFREQKDLVPVSTEGLFDVAIGEGTANFPGSTSKIYDYMNNSGTVSCAEGGTFLLSASDKRFLDVQFNPNGTAGWNHITPASEIRAVPYATNAISAEKLNGLVATDFVRKVDFSPCTTGQFVTYNGSVLGCDTPAGGSSVDSSYSIKGLVQFLTNAATSGIVVTNGVAQVNTGTGANQIVKLDGTGKLPAVDGSALTGIVASSATTATTAGSATNFTGSLSGDVSGTQSTTSVDKVKGMSVVTTGAANGKVLKYSSGTLVFADDDTGTTPTTVANFSGSLVGDVSGTQGATSVDKIKGAAVDTTGIANGKILKYDGTKWVMSDDATGGSPSDSSYSAKGVVQFDTSAAVSGITVASGLAKVNAGTGANQIVQLDSSSKLPAVDGSALTNIVASSLSGILPIAKGGTGQSTKQAGFDALSPLAAKGSLITHDGTNNVSLAVGSTNGYVLMVDSAAGAGVKWAAPTATDLTTITGTGIVQRTGAGTYAALGTTAPINVTGSNIGLAYGTGLTTSAGSLVVDTGTTANKIVQMDSSGKLPAVDGSQLTGVVASSASTATTATNFSGSLVGDVSGTQGATSVDKIKGATVDTTGIASGKILKYDGTKWTMADDATGGAPADSSYAAKGIVQFDTSAAVSGITVASGLAKVNSGTGANQIVKLDGSAKLPAVDGSALTNLPTPTSVANFSGSLVGDVSGTQGATSVDKIKGATVDTTGIASGKILKYDGTKWTMADDATGTAPGDSSYAAKGIVQFDTSAAISGITIASGLAKVNVGTGANQIVQLDSSGKLPAIDGSALTNIVASSISGTLAITKGGTGQTTKTAAFDALSPLAAKGSIVTHDGTNNVTLPVGSTNGYVLMVDSAAGTGIKWGSPTATDLTTITGTGIVQRTGAGTYTALGTTAPLGITGSNLTLTYGNGLYSNSGTLSVDTGTTAGKIVILETGAKLPAVDGSQLTGVVASSLSGTLTIANGGTGQTTKTAAFDALSPLTTAGDLVTSDGTNNIRMARGTTGQILSSTASGLQWITPNAGTVTGVTGNAPITISGTAAAPVVNVSAATTSASGVVQVGSGISVSSGVIAADPASFPSVVPVSKGGTGLSSITANRMIASNGTGGFAAFNCGVGQVVTFDASGNIGCTNYASTGFLINGGNSGAVTVGSTDNTLTLMANNASALVVDSSQNIEIQKTITSKTTSNTGTSISFAGGNLQYTSSSCGAFTLSGMKDGGTYMLAVKGATSATCSFTHTGFTVHLPPDHGATTASTHTMYTFVVMGTDIYSAWVTGY